MSQQNMSLERALPIVAAAYAEQFGVNVVLSGTNACTDGKTIVLPMLKATSDLKDVLFGYLAHEASHVRESDFDVIDECQSELEKSFLNIIEDIRIEQLIQEVFPGTQFTLNAMWTYIVEESLCPPAKPEDSEASQLCQYLLHRLNTEYLKREASLEAAESSAKVVDQTFPVGFFVRLDGILSKYMGSLTCTRDCLILARAILKALDEAEEEERQKGQHENPDNQNVDFGSNAQDDSKPDSGKQELSEDANANQSSDTAGNTVSLYEKLISETDLPGDVIDLLKGPLVQQAREDNSGKSITIETSSVGEFATDHDDTSGLQTGIIASSVIRSRLGGLLQAQSREQPWLSARGKRVDGKRLVRLVAGDSRVFNQREEKKRFDTALHVLLDTSSSMKNSQDIANQATVSLSLAVSSIPKTDVAVSMFPGIAGNVSPILHRGLPIRANLGRFAVTSSGTTPMADAMLYAARELAASKRQRKVLIIITDGEPSNGGAVHYLNDLIAAHVDTYAIGINSTAVSKYFKNWSVISDVSELQKALFEIAGKFLNIG